MYTEHIFLSESSARLSHHGCNFDCDCSGMSKHQVRVVEVKKKKAFNLIKVASVGSRKTGRAQSNICQHTKPKST